MDDQPVPAASVPPHDLFLSYGRKDARSLADRLFSDLSAHGYKPWRDTRELRAGREWEDQIERAIHESRAMLALLSPHSVRHGPVEATSRPGGDPSVPSRRVEVDDSVCLDEISCAHEERIPIVPAMVIRCRPPFSLARLQFVDFVGWQDESTYRRAFARLLDGIADALKGRVAERRLVTRLVPLDFRGYLEEKRQQFTGREWLFARVESRLQQTAQRALLIVGGPGLGKSAFVAEFVHRNPGGRIIACYCCRASAPATLKPGSFVRTIASMIATQIPEYEAAIEDPGVSDALSPDKSDEDPKSALELGVLDVLRTIQPPDGPRVVVIDALDEALSLQPAAGQQSLTIVDLLMPRVSRLPSWLKLVATTRNDDAVLNRLRGLAIEEIAAENKENLEDVRDYIEARLHEPGLAAILAEAGKSAESVQFTLSDSAKGNFLYVIHALDMLASEADALDRLGSLPPTLGGQYEEFFRSRFPSETAFAPVRAVLEALVSAMDSLTIDDLSWATGLDAKAALPTALKSVSSFLRRERMRGDYALDHKSIGDWLTDEERVGSTYYVSRLSGHQRLARGFEVVYRGHPEKLSKYALTHFADHLSVLTKSDLPSAERDAAVEQLADFALDRAVLERQTDCPLDALNALQLATEAASRTRGPDRLALACRAALGLVAFRRDRLNTARVFTLAAAGHLDKVERELDLFAVDAAWRDASLLTAIWVANDAHPDEARRMRDRVTLSPTTDPALAERVDAALAKRAPALPAPYEGTVDETEVVAMLAQIGGMDLEARSGYAETLSEPVASPGPDQTCQRTSDDEAPVFMSEIHSPRLVAHVLQHPELLTAATDPVRDYIELHAANAYRLYRNESLYGILRAVLAHSDDNWARRTLQKLVTSALAGGEPVFDEMVPIVLDAWKGIPGARVEFDQRVAKAVSGVGTLSPSRGLGDSWCHHKRRLAALIEAGALVLHDTSVSRDMPPIDDVNIPSGYAGPAAPGWLTVAESLHLARRPWKDVDFALSEASVSADNVQDATFCLKSVSRVHALLDLWWKTPAGVPRAIVVRDVVERFVENPFTAEFAAKHNPAWTFPGRRDRRETHPLPSWALHIDTVDRLASAYQVSPSRILELNPNLDSRTSVLSVDTRVPDPELAPLMAARLSAAVLSDTTLAEHERTDLIQSLVPIAAANATALDTVLGRLLIAGGPLDGSLIDRLAAIVRAAAPITPQPADGGLAGRKRPISRGVIERG